MGRRLMSALLNLGLRKSLGGLGLPPLGTGGSAPLVWRATNQGASMMVQGFQSSTTVYRVNRRAQRLPVSFRRFRVAVPVVYPNVSTLVDEFFASNYKFQHAFNPVFTEALTGLPAATVQATWSGSSALTYTASGWDTNVVLLVSDVIDMGVTIPAGQAFEHRSAIVGPATALPWTNVRTSDTQAYAGVAGSTSDLMASNDIMTRTSFSAHASGSGDSSFFDNSFLIVEAQGAAKNVLTIGDSLLYATAYDFGDAYGEAGIIGRGLARRAIMHCNFGRGSDGDFNLVDGTKWALRRKVIEQLHALAPFELAIHANGVNDCTKQPNISAWAATTAYTYGQVVTVSSRIYMCVVAGTSGSTAPTHTSGTVTDGSVSWLYWGANGVVAIQREAILSGNTANTLRLLRASINVPVWGWKVTPNATSATGFISPDDQVVASGWGDATSLRGRVNARRVANPSVFSFAGIIDTTGYLESGADTSKWILGATANLYTPEGVHTKAAGSLLAAPALDIIPLAA